MAKTYPVITMIEGQPTFEVPLRLILASCKQGGGVKILNPLEYHTDRQRRWYKGICLRGLSDWSGDTPDDWDLVLKAHCNGIELLKKEKIYLPDNKTCYRLTIVGVGKKNLTAFIQNILSKALEMDWPITPPNPELRK